MLRANRWPHDEWATSLDVRRRAFGATFTAVWEGGEGGQQMRSEKLRRKFVTGRVLKIGNVADGSPWALPVALIFFFAVLMDEGDWLQAVNKFKQFVRHLVAKEMKCDFDSFFSLPARPTCDCSCWQLHSFFPALLGRYFANLCMFVLREIWH